MIVPYYSDHAFDAAMDWLLTGEPYDVEPPHVPLKLPGESRAALALTVAAQPSGHARGPGVTDLSSSVPSGPRPSSNTSGTPGPASRP